MENDSAFQPLSSLHALAGATTAPTAIQLTGSPTSGSFISLRAYNAGSVDAFLAYGPTAAAAAANAVVPTAGSPTQCIVIPTTKEHTITVPPGQFWTAVTGSSTATVYVQTGLGV